MLLGDAVARADTNVEFGQLARSRAGPFYCKGFKIKTPTTQCWGPNDKNTNPPISDVSLIN